MSTRDRSRVDAILDEALSVPDEDRSRVLDERCGSDHGLRKEVEILLRLAFAPAPGLQPAVLPRDLVDAAITAAAAIGSEAAEGQTIGSWRIVREIGRGGMGAVYLVERADGQFQQQGALKVIPSAGLSDEVARRFKRERRILASLSHTAIAKLLDGGQTHDGRPFFVMEFIEGRPITRFCDEQRLTIEERIRLFIRVGGAVDYAHRQLILHRDIKPSNIAVTADGEVKLLDFGIARLLSTADAVEDEPVTRAAARMLTPEYASPEQIRGQPTGVASDVYQLGLLLHELLTGQRAQTIPDAAPSALEHAICEAAPERPSLVAAGVPPDVLATRRIARAGLVHALRGDLDAIIFTALHKDPARRYPSVRELLQDLHRYLTGRPVSAQGDSVSYRARKFVNRHRAALGWCAGVLIVAAAGLSAWTAQRWRARQEAARAQQVESMIGNLFALANPRVRPQPRIAISYIDDAVRLVRTELSGQPRSQARLLTHLGRVYNALGHYGPSIAVLQEALALRRGLYGSASVEVGDTLSWLGQSQHYAGRYDEAENSVREALAIRRAQHGIADPATIGTAIELGDLLHTRGKLTDAERVLRDVVAAVRTTDVRARPEDEGHDSVPRAMRDLANVLRDRGLLDESASLYDEAIAIFRRLHGEPHQQIATSQVYFARLLIMRGELARAEAVLDRCLPDLRRIYEGDHAMVGMALREFGYLRTEQGRFEEALTLLDDAQRVQRQWLGPDHPMIARARAHQAELALRMGRLADAVSLSRQTLAALDGRGLADHPSAIDARRTLGEALWATHDRDGARRELSDALAGAERQFVPGDLRTRRIRSALERARE